MRNLCYVASGGRAWERGYTLYIHVGTFQWFVQVYMNIVHVHVYTCTCMCKKRHIQYALGTVAIYEN